MEVEGPGSPLTAAEAGEVIETQPAVSDEAASIVIFLIESRFPLLLGECFRGDWVFLKTVSAMKAKNRWE